MFTCCKCRWKYFTGIVQILSSGEYHCNFLVVDIWILSVAVRHKPVYIHVQVKVYILKFGRCTRLYLKVPKAKYQCLRGPSFIQCGSQASRGWHMLACVKSLVIATCIFLFQCPVWIWRPPQDTDGLHGPEPQWDCCCWWWRLSSRSSNWTIASTRWGRPAYRYSAWRLHERLSVWLGQCCRCQSQWNSVRLIQQLFWFRSLCADVLTIFSNSECNVLGHCFFPLGHSHHFFPTDVCCVGLHIECTSWNYPNGEE